MNEIIISNIPPQNININEGGVTGITTVYVNGVDVTVGNNAYVLVPTKLSELQNDTHFISQESDPTVPTWVKAISISDINNWNSKQNQLTAGTNIEINDNVISAPLTDYVKFTDYADYGKAGVIKPQSGSGEASLTYYGFGVADNGQPFAYAARSYIGYDRLHFNAFISKETLETAIEGKELTNKTYVDSANTLQDNEINNLKSENDYLNSIINQLPKVSSQGTILTLNNTINGRMNIELGASELIQDATPTPDSPQDIHTISGDNSIEVVGKNLWNENTQVFTNQARFTTSKDSNNVWTFTITGSNGYSFATSNITLQAGTYTVSATVDNGDFIILKGSATQPNTFTLAEETQMTLRVYKNGVVGDTVKLSKVMIEKNNQATTYKPYKSASYPISLGDLEYCKIGDYEDIFFKNVISSPLYNATLELDKWYLQKNIGKVVLDGSETWGYSGATSIFYTSSIIDYATSGNIPFSNYYSGVDNVAGSGGMISQPNNTIAFISASGQTTPRFYVKDTRYTDNTNDFKTWLSTHNLILYYVLATPTYTPITGTLAEQLENIYQYLLSYKQQTNISQVPNDLPFNISASALLDLNTLVGGN